MSYVVPSVLVYQQLASNAGVANITPDLDACIIGPCNNVVSYLSDTAAHLATSAALTAPGGSSASIVSNAITNIAYLGSTKVGQIVNQASIAVYLNAAYVESKVLYMTGTASNNTLTFASYSGSATAVQNSKILTSVANVAQLNVGDVITVAGVNTAGSDLTTTITAISGSSVTMNDAAVLNAGSAGITRTAFNNLNLNSSTLRVESGDRVVITYGGNTFSTEVLSVTYTNSTSTIATAILTTDVLPLSISAPFTVSVRKNYNNLVLPISYGGHTNYDASSVAVSSNISIFPLPVVSYGTVISGNIYIAYKALRNDLTGLIEINNVDDINGTLGSITDENPLALATELALANTVGRIMVVAVASDDLAGYLEALELVQNSRVYALVPLTQDISILTAFQQHVDQMSTPEFASWRITLVNTAIPSVAYVGQYNPNLINANGGNNSITNISGVYVLTSSNSTFFADGVAPGDTLKITSHAPAAQTVTSLTITGILNNQQITVNAPLGLTSVNFYVQRTLSKLQQAEIIAANSDTFKDSRVIHVQPDLVGVEVNGVTKYLPGYYAAAAVSGLVSGLPAQQSLTNIGLAGITDLLHSNRYFTRAQLSTISAAGTFLLVQEAAGTIPYVRHSLTTDMTVLQYRELQQVKNIDFLSYFFHDILKGFPGKYNITPDTLQTLRTTIIAGAKLLQGKKLPKIGAPLLDYQIQSIAQDKVNKDNVIVQMPVTMPTVMNYVTLYLIY